MLHDLAGQLVAAENAQCFFDIACGDQRYDLHMQIGRMRFQPHGRDVVLREAQLGIVEYADDIPCIVVDQLAYDLSAAGNGIGTDVIGDGTELFRRQLSDAVNGQVGFVSVGMADKIRGMLGADDVVRCGLAAAESCDLILECHDPVLIIDRRVCNFFVCAHQHGQILPGYSYTSQM